MFFCGHWAVKASFSTLSLPACFFPPPHTYSKLLSRAVKKNFCAPPFTWAAAAAADAAAASASESDTGIRQMSRQRKGKERGRRKREGEKSIAARRGHVILSCGSDREKKLFLRQKKANAHSLMEYGMDLGFFVLDSLIFFSLSLSRITQI